MPWPPDPDLRHPTPDDPPPPWVHGAPPDDASEAARRSTADPSHRGRRPPRPDSARRTGPMRRQAGLTRPQRVVLHVRRDAVLHEIRRLDDELQELTRRRIDLLERARALRDDLWPIVPGVMGRRPPAVDEDPLAPVAADAQLLWGPALRAVALDLLRAHGPLRLDDLHDLLHRLGYAVDSTTPVKTLADALGYEADAGRAVRVSRGTYAAAGPPPEPRPRRPATAPPWAAARVAPPFTSRSPEPGSRATRPPYGPPVIAEMHVGPTPKEGIP
ncbi:hypothetical protein [Actinomarinicola tropica]|uniref:hypothetical protein n=1 Tax=Actinomarinicola tropica TaxID=2789776 RepID=UPI00189A03B3|nr:hypothetical protein [Actinomarinicola tropica]